MSFLSRFIGQSQRDYRNFQIVYGFLALHFIIPGLGYLVKPDLAVAAFIKLGARLGGGLYPLYEVSYLWRILAATNVLTLGLMCVLLQLDVRRNWPVIYPLVFMKAATAFCFAVVYLRAIPYPAFLMIAAWDLINCAAFVYFGRAGRRAALADESSLVPPIYRASDVEARSGCAPR